MQLPTNILSGFWKESHVQGIAVDLAKEHIYFSFTTILLKTDFSGKPLGSVGQHGIPGCDFPLGSTGVFAVGDGRFYFSDPGSNKEEKTFSSKVGLYRLDKTVPSLFLPIP